MTEENNGEKPEVKTFTQEQVNALVAEAKRKEREKIPTDYDDLKAKASKFDDLEQASKTELQKALDKAAALETELTGYKTKEQVAGWAAEIVKDSDIPASVLRGSTREELEQHFEQLKSLAPKPKRTSAPAGHATGDGQGSRSVAALRQLGFGSD
jgi:phage terminase Nu1 subunit (DNA packaging protein)